MVKYKIADLIIDISSPRWVLHDNLNHFEYNNGQPDLRCNIIFKNRKDIDAKAWKLADTAGTTIYDEDGCIHIRNRDKSDIPSLIVISRDLSDITMYIDPDYTEIDGEPADCVRDGVLAALRSIMIAKLSEKHGLMIHSSSIIWRNKGILFSAPSGTGKSTHAHLWMEYLGTPILDGDANVCRLIDGIPTVYGLPWCGTSNEFRNESVPLEAIVFLQQSDKNSIEKLGYFEALLRLTARSFMTPWNEAMMDRFLNNAQEIAARTDCYLLSCRPDVGAVELVRKCLEK